MVTLVHITITQLLVRVALSELGNVKHALIFHLSNCMLQHKHTGEINNLDKTGNNVIDVVQQISLCWETTLHRCEEHHKEAYAYLYKYPVCGVLNTGMQLVPYNWIFSVYSQFGVHLTFPDFHLPYTRDCHNVAVSVGNGISTLWTELWRFGFCGKRAPWSMAYSQPYANITVASQVGKIPYGAHFMLIYEAIDAKSPFIEKVCANFMADSKLRGHTTFGNQYTTPQRIIHTYHFAARSYRFEVICISFSQDLDLKLYDGPGPLSRAVNITDKERSKFCFSRYRGYAEMYLTNVSSGSIAYTVNKSESFSLGFCQKSIHYPANESWHFQANDTGTGVHCIWTIDHKFEVMQIHHMLFAGYDALIFDSSPYTYSSVCHYGGLQVIMEFLDYDRVFSFVSLCSSNYNKPSIPHGIYPDVRIYLLFTTFDKYSTGSMEVSLIRSDCKFYDLYLSTLNRRIFPVPSYTYKQSQTHREEIPHCKGIWISNIHSLQLFGVVRHGYSWFTLTHQDLNRALLGGTHNVSIYHWMFAETQFTLPVDVDHYNFIINATVPRDFPLDLRMVQKMIIVQRDKVAQAYLPHIRGLTFWRNYSLIDTVLHKFVVRIKFIQNWICYSPMKRPENIPLGINQLYFDPRRLADKAIGYKDTRGTENCDVMLKGTACERGVIKGADMIIDHYYPEGDMIQFTGDYRNVIRYTEYIKELDKWMYFAYDIKLNISIYNKTQQCLKACSLDITIWENLELTPQVVRMLKWEDIKVLLWRVQATKHGFRLSIHQECSSPCIHMCDVSVEIMLYEEHINCLKPYNNFSGEVSAEVTGSWSDANAYCEQKGMQLLSFTSDDEKDVDNFGKLVCSLTKQQEGLQPNELSVFMGFYKSSQVSLCLTLTVPVTTIDALQHFETG